MKLFPVRGGVHPDYRKDRTSESAIVALPLPQALYLPLQQHIGAPAEPVVAEGEHVLKGQLLAHAGGAVSAPTHAPTSGVITAITDVTAPHPSGLPQKTIILEPDGKDEWAVLPAPIADPFAAEPEAIRRRVAESGIVGMGGATFPSAVKLGLGTQKKIHTLLLNGAECEPYLTCDDRVMREYAAEVVDGARIMARALGAPKVVVGIEENKPQAIAAMTGAAKATPNVEVVAVPVQYPMGSERHLTQAITGLETPARKLTADLGVVVHNVGTARAVHHAVRFGRPLLSRVVTVSGGAIAKPGNVEAPLGTLVSELVEFCGGLSEAPRRIVNGGPMMGQPLPNLDVPVVKGTCGILALTAGETDEQPPGPCIRCGTCVTICPCGLVPVEMASYIRKDNLEAAAKTGVMDCVSCGSCSYICPSHIPLVHYFNYAKGALNALDRERRKQDATKALVEAHTIRVEKAAAAKKAAAAAAAAKRAAEAAAAQASETSADKQANP
ncbi:MAG: electron transport complex subunit RsxC [Magnetospirillum sp.]|nr:electron transport complex subunit RsxC [Magnetospirillum sp.]